MPAALLLASEGGFTVTGPHVITSFELFGMTWNLTETVFIQWIVMLVLLVVAAIAGFSIRSLVKSKKSGKGCAGCSGGCSHCSDQNSECSK